jgi:hypothetical protein
MKFIGVATILLASACSAFEPETGPFQGAHEGGASTSGGYGPSDAAGRGTGPDPRCAPDGGFADDDCDLCANASCCTERFACLDDPGCSDAAETFENCPADAGIRPPSCWNDLAASSALSRTFVSCVSAHCKTQCAAP